MRKADANDVVLKFAGKINDLRLVQPLHKRVDVNVVPPLTDDGNLIYSKELQLWNIEARETEATVGNDFISTLIKLLQPWNAVAQLEQFGKSGRFTLVKLLQLIKIDWIFVTPLKECDGNITFVNELHS